MTHAPTHMTNPKITRAPLPALLPTILPIILTGLFILAGCGGSALPIPVIATESTDVADNLETRAPDSILLSVGEQPPVDTVKSAPPPNTPPNTPIVQVQKQEPKPKQEEVKKQVQAPAPVFEVAVAPARPPQRSFSQAEPQVSTDFVPRSDATGESHASDNVITFADWTDSFTNAPPTKAETTTITITSTRRNIFRDVHTVDYGTVYSDGAKTMPIGQRILARANVADEFKDADGFLIHKDAGEYILEDDTRVPYAAGAPFVTTVAVELTDKEGNPVLDGENNSIMVARRVKLTKEQDAYIQQNGRFTRANKETGLTDPAPITRDKTAGVKNEFLQGGAGGRLDETPRDDGPAGQVANRGSLNLATATFGGRKLGGDAADGVAFFRGFDGAPAPNDRENGYEHTSAGLAHNYAGLYSGTNLGAPVSESGSASWNGRIRTIGYFKFDMDFTLRVTFGEGNIGTLNVARLKNPANLNQFLEITNATYDANGVVSGAILIDEENDNLGIGPQYGFLSGLIGADGAVVAFLSSGTNDEANDATSGEKEDITDGSHRFGFAGGFVARPGVVANPDVTIEDWTGSFTNPLPRGVKKHTLNQDVLLNQFLLRDDPAKRPSWKKPDGGSLSLSALGGDATDGVDFFPADVTIYSGVQSATSQNYFAGLWDSTNLGAPIPLGVAFNGDMTAMWKGKFSVFQGANARFDDDDFTLAIDFVNNTFRATVEAGTEDYYMNGSYMANGFLEGGVSRTADGSVRNGIISGLIGSDGVVAAFVSSDNGDNRNEIEGGMGDTGYAGGFVARPGLTLDDVVDASDINYNNIPTTVAGLIYTDNPNSRFLRIEGLNIDFRGLTNPVIHTRRLDYTAGSAGFGDGYVIIDPHGYAALLPTTDLGAARPVGLGQTTDARWAGTYSLSGNGAFAPNTPINFDINFDAGTLTGTAPLANSLTDDITIEATFGADGVMSGTFSTDKEFRDDKNEVYTINQVNTNVIGLIGTEGLVGIMHGNVIVGTTVTGGFVASP